MLTFDYLQKKYGDVVAYSILMDIERHLSLNSTQLAAIEPQERFKRAIHLMEGSAFMTVAHLHTQNDRMAD